MSIYDIINDLPGFSDDRLRELVRSGNPAERLLSAGELSQREKLRSEVQAKPQGSTTVLDRIAGQAQQPVPPPRPESQMPKQAPQGIGAIAPRGFADGGSVRPYTRRFRDIEGAYVDDKGIGNLVGRPYANGMPASTSALAPEMAGQLGYNYAPSDKSNNPSLGIGSGIGRLWDKYTDIHPLLSPIKAGMERGFDASGNFDPDIDQFSFAQNLRGEIGDVTNAGVEFAKGVAEKAQEFNPFSPITDFAADYWNLGDDAPPEDITVLGTGDVANATATETGKGGQTTGLDDATLTSNQRDGAPQIGGGAPNSGGVKADMEKGGYEESMPAYLKEVERTKKELEEVSKNVAPGNKEKWMAIAMGAFNAAASGAPTFMGGLAELGKSVTENLSALNREERATALAAAKQAYESAAAYAALQQENTQLHIEAAKAEAELMGRPIDLIRLQQDANEGYLNAAKDLATVSGVQSDQATASGKRAFALQWAVNPNGIGSPAAQQEVNKAITETLARLKDRVKKYDEQRRAGKISTEQYNKYVSDEAIALSGQLGEEDRATQEIFNWYQSTLNTAARNKNPGMIPPWINPNNLSSLRDIQSGAVFEQSNK